MTASRRRTEPNHATIPRSVDHPDTADHLKENFHAITKQPEPLSTNHSKHATDTKHQNTNRHTRATEPEHLHNTNTTYRDWETILAKIDYSLNDTIIIYNHIRENFHVLHKTSLIENINVSITQTLLRTIATSLSTTLTLLALLFFNDEILTTFALTLLINMIMNTYSSIYISTTILIWLKLNIEDLIPPVTEAKTDDDHP